MSYKLNKSVYVQTQLISTESEKLAWCSSLLVLSMPATACKPLPLFNTLHTFTGSAFCTCCCGHLLCIHAPKEAIPLSYTLPKACSSIFSFLDVQGTFVACVYAYSKHGGTQRVPDPSFPREPVSGKQETCSEEHILLPFFFLLLAEKLQMCSLDVFLETSLR